MTGLSHCSGDYVFLLDSDDFWPPDYISIVMEAIKRNGTPDLLFSGLVSVDKDGVQQTVHRSLPTDVDHGYNYLISRYTTRWLGDVTSTIAIKRPVLSTILEKSKTLADRYRLNADDAIVVAADLLGFRKVFLAGTNIFYRVHGDNAWVNAPLPPQRKHQIFIRKCLLFATLYDSCDPTHGFDRPAICN